MLYVVLSVVIIAGYLLGNVNFALILSKLKKSDIRKSDSGNPGAMNMFRKFGKKFGTLTLFLDGLKGVAAAILGWFLLGEAFGAVQLPQEAFSLTFGAISAGEFFRFSQNHLGMFVGGASAIVGHIFPVFLKFKGGKGIATTIGVCFTVCPLVALISLILGVVFIIITKLGAITSFIIITPPLAYSGYIWSGSSGISRFLVPSIALFIFLLTLWRHRSNIKKLFNGTENKTVLFKKKR